MAFAILLIIYIAALTFLFIAFILKSMRDSLLNLVTYNTSGYISRSFVQVIVIFIIVIISLVTSRMLEYYPSFNDPDPITYINDVLTVSKQGSFTPTMLAQHLYYQGFPVFTLNMLIGTYVLGLDPSIYILIITLASDLLFVILVVIIIKLLNLRPTIALLLLPLLLLSNPYLLRIMQTSVPYALSTSITGLFVFSVLRSLKGTNIRLLAVILSLLALNHAEFIYIGMHTLSLIVLGVILYVKKLKDLLLRIGYIGAMIGLVGITYILAYQLGLFVLSRQIINAFGIIKVNIATLTVGELGSLERPYPYLSALGYATQTAIVLAITFTFIMRILFERLRPQGYKIRLKVGYEDIFFTALALVTSLIFMIGGLWYIFRVPGPGNLLMYAYITAFVISPFIWIYMGRFIDIILRTSGRTLYLLLIMGIALVATVGTLLDPLAYPTPTNSYFIESNDYPKYHTIINILCSHSISSLEKLYVPDPKISVYSHLYCSKVGKLTSQGLTGSIVINIGYPHITYYIT